MRRFWFALTTLVVLFLVADHVARDYAEGRVANELKESLDLAKRPHVSIGGWPFVVKVWSGELPSLVAEAEAVREGDLVLGDLRVELRDIKVSLEDLLDASAGRVRIGSGRGSAHLVSEALTRALRAAGVAVNVTIDEGRLLVQPDQGPEVEGTIEVDRDTLVLAAPGLGEVTIALPTPIDGLRYTEVALEGSRAALRFELTRTRLDITNSR